MDTDRRLVDIRNLLANAGDQLPKFIRNRIAGRIRNIQYRCPSVDHRFEYLVQIRWFGPAGVFGIKLYIVGVLPSVFNRRDRHLDCLGFFFAQRLAVFFIGELSGDIDILNTQSRMDPAAFGFGQRFAAGINIRRKRP